MTISKNFPNDFRSRDPLANEFYFFPQGFSRKRRKSEARIERNDSQRTRLESSFRTKLLDHQSQEFDPMGLERIARKVLQRFRRNRTRDRHRRRQRKNHWRRNSRIQPQAIGHARCTKMHGWLLLPHRVSLIFSKIHFSPRKSKYLQTDFLGAQTLKIALDSLFHV